MLARQWAMKTVLVIWITLLHLQPSWGSEAVSQYACDIQNNYESPFVKAYFERPTIASGCNSTEKTDHDQEVHIISIDNVQAYPRHTRKDQRDHITLHIRPRSSSGRYSRSLIFVLQSSRPVNWRIKSERLSNRSRALFYLDRECRLMHDKSVKTKVKKVSLPGTPQRLMEWARHQLGAVTTLTRTEHVTTFNKGVGIDERWGDRCILTPDEWPSAVGITKQQQVGNGCAADVAAGRSKYVHIVELHDSSRPPRPEIGEVHVQVLASEGVRTTELHLVLKAHHPTRWRVSAKKFRGKVIVWTDEQVENDGVHESIQEIVARLGNYSGQSLANHVPEITGTGPIASYTEFKLANRMVISVKPEDTNAIRPTKDALSSNVAINDEGPSRKQVRRNNTSPFDNPAKTRVAINRAKRVSCENGRILISLRRAILKRVGVRSEHLSLLDTTCIAHMNQTHYILETGLDQCDTTSTRRRGMQHQGAIHYQNQIVVHKVDGLAPYDDEDGSTGMEASGYEDPTHFDDEDFMNTDTESIRVTVQCEYAASQPSPPRTTFGQDSKKPRTYNVGNIKFDLSIFKDETFREQHTEFPHNINEKEEIFVEASVRGDCKLRVVVHKCWVAPGPDSTPPESNPQNHEQQLLIDQGCLHDVKGTHWQDGDEGPATRFSFKYHKYFEKHLLHYLHCQLAVCLDGQPATNVQKCVPQHRYCVEGNINKPGSSNPNGQLLLRYSEVVYKGPIQLIIPQDTSPGIGGSTPSTVEGSGAIDSDDSSLSENQQVIRFEGLDSGTVVGIAFASFLIGVLLTAALWFIHTHTGPIRKSNRPRSTETSGESTPSSTAPITIHQIHT